jgi:hypothetical protein
MHGPTRIFWANLTPFSLQFRAEFAAARQPVIIGLGRTAVSEKNSD